MGPERGSREREIDLDFLADLLNMITNGDSPYAAG